MTKLIFYFGEMAYGLRNFFEAHDIEAYHCQIKDNILTIPEEIEAWGERHALTLPEPDGGEIWAILVAGMAINYSSLGILSRYDRQRIKVFYIIPDLFFEDLAVKINHKIIYNIFQEYARSAKFESIYLFDMSIVEKTYDGLSFADYEQKIFEIISYAIAINEKLLTKKPHISTNKKEDEAARIKTISILNLNNMEEKPLFNLLLPKEIVYKFLVDRDKLENKEFRNNILEFIKKDSSEEIRKMFEIYKEDGINIALVVQKSQIIQQ